jgi:hypothetical protein
VGVPILACRWVGRVYMGAGCVAQISGEPAPTRNRHLWGRVYMDAGGVENMRVEVPV